MNKGIKYTIALKFMFFYEIIPFNKLRKTVEKWCNKLYDYAYTIDYSYEFIREIQETDDISTPCGCSIFNDCSECSNNSMCLC